MNTKNAMKIRDCKEDQDDSFSEFHKTRGREREEKNKVSPGKENRPRDRGTKQGRWGKQREKDSQGHKSVDRGKRVTEVQNAGSFRFVVKKESVKETNPEGTSKKKLKSPT